MIVEGHVHYVHKYGRAYFGMPVLTYNALFIVNKVGVVIPS